MLIMDSPFLAKLAEFDAAEQARMDRMVENARSVGSVGRTVARGAYNLGKAVTAPIYKGVGALAQRFGNSIVDQPIGTLSKVTNIGGGILSGWQTYSQHSDAINSIPHRYF